MLFLGEFTLLNINLIIYSIPLWLNSCFVVVVVVVSLLTELYQDYEHQMLIQLIQIQKWTCRTRSVLKKKRIKPKHISLKIGQNETWRIQPRLFFSHFTLHIRTSYIRGHSLAPNWAFRDWTRFGKSLNPSLRNTSGLVRFQVSLEVLPCGWWF